MIRVVMPVHLRVLGQIQGELQLDVPPPVTQRAIIDAIEARYPMLAGTLRDHGSSKRRPMIRFYACNEDLSHEPPDAPVPEQVVSGREPFYVIAAIAGG